MPLRNSSGTIFTKMSFTSCVARISPTSTLWWSTTRSTPHSGCWTDTSATARRASSGWTVTGSVPRSRRATSPTGVARFICSGIAIGASLISGRAIRAGGQQSRLTGLRARQGCLRGVGPEEFERLGAGVPVLVMDALRHEHGVAWRELRFFPLRHEKAGSFEDEVDLLGLLVDVVGAGLARLEDGDTGHELLGTDVGRDEAEDLAAHSRIVKADPDLLAVPERRDETNLHSSAASLSRPGTGTPSYSAVVGSIIRIGRSRACSSTKWAASPKLLAIANRKSPYAGSSRSAVKATARAPSMLTATGLPLWAPTRAASALTAAI